MSEQDQKLTDDSDTGSPGKDGTKQRPSVWWLLVLVVSFNVHAQPELRDPTRPPPSDALFPAQHPAPTAEAWVLNSTLVAPDRRSAVINGTLVSEGDWLGRTRIVSVHHNEVRLESEGRLITVRLIPSDIKRNRRVQ